MSMHVQYSPHQGGKLQILRIQTQIFIKKIRSQFIMTSKQKKLHKSLQPNQASLVLAG